LADFNADIPQVQSPITPVQPVSNNTAAMAINAGGGLLGGLGAAVINSANYATQLAQMKYKANALGELQQNIERVQDLQSQGVLSQDAALRNIRRTTVSSLANHPLLQDDINKLVGTLTGTALQHDVENGTYAEQEQRTLQNKFISDAQAAGYGSPNDPPAVQQQMAHAYQGVQLAAAQLKQQSEVVAFQKSQVELGNAKLATIAANQNIGNNAITTQRNKIGLTQDINKLNFTQGVGNLAANLTPKFNADLDQIHNDTTLTPEQKQMKYDSVINNISDAVTGVAVGADSTGSINAISDIFKRRVQVYKDQDSGKIAADAAQTQLSNLLTTSQLALANKNPEVLQLAAVSKTFPAAANILQGDIAGQAVKLLQTNGGLPDANGNFPTTPGNPVHSTPTEQKSVQQYSDILRENLRQVNSGVKMDPDHQKEINSNFNNMMAGFGVYAGTAADATGLKTAVQTFASPEFGLYASNPKNGFDADASDKASKAFDQYYKTSLVPLLQDSFLNSQVVVGSKMNPNPATALLTNQPLIVADTAPATSKIHTDFANGSVRFVPNDPTDQNSVSASNDLNTKIAPILQTTIKADAHLHQSTNYEFWYNDLMNTIQPPNTHGIDLFPEGSNLPVGKANDTPISIPKDK
jgi:hypothetical protein